jgi:D-glycero-beta-D-manno-heptose 1-phosphate adenylyltransferase
VTLIQTPTKDARLLDLAVATRMANIWRFKDERIVFTNGCFDILHRGHVEYLQEAAALGDRLIVGLNSDASVRRLGKGPDRPLNDEHARASLLCALRCVDAVVLFGEDDPLLLIRVLKPDVLVKGGDWKPEQIVGADVVKAYGGEVRSLRFVEGFSTSGLLARLRNG